jgi:hypothetical protein
MTGKDVLMLLLCTFGYERNVKIEVTRTGLEEPCYYIYAENKDGDVFVADVCEGLMFSIYMIISHMTKYDRYIRAPSDKTQYLNLHDLNFESKWWEVPPKIILDKIKKHV